MNTKLVKNLARHACRTIVGPIVTQPSIDLRIQKSFQLLTEHVVNATPENQRKTLARLRWHQSLLTLCYPHPYYKWASLPNGMRIKVDVADIIGLSLYTGAPIPDIVELEIVRTLTPHNGTFFDVGANIGLYSVLAGIAVGPTGHVHSFEPVSTTHQILVENVSSNLPSSSSQVVRTAIGNTVGEIEIHVSEQSGLSSVVNNRKNRLLRTETAPISTIDEYCLTNNVETIDFLKIDVEGFEWEVFLGSQKTLSHTNPVLLVELIEAHLLSAGSSQKMVLDKLAELGFNGWVINRDTRTLSRVTDSSLAQRRGVNYVFARETNPNIEQLRAWERSPITTRFTL